MTFFPPNLDYFIQKIIFLVSNGAKYSSFHILGASLGAHVAGYVGHFCQGRLGRITGLDPSGPLFHSVHESEKLSKHDALFVGKKKMC